MLKQLHISFCLMAVALGFATDLRAQFYPTPDSIYKINEEGQLTSRSYFRYDAQSRQTGVAHLTWNKKTGEWVGTYQELVEYDDAGNVVDKKTSFWDTDKYDWKLAEHEKASYDTEGRLTSSEVMRFNVRRDTWIGENKQEIKYNADGQRALATTYKWDDDLGKWMPFEKTSSEYTQKLKTTDTKQTWRQGQWENAEKTAYEYDAKSRALASATTSGWNGAAWVPSTKTAYSKTASGDKTTVVTDLLTYDSATSQWISQEKQTTTLDSHGSETLSTREKWNGKEWVITERERTDLAYDQWGHCTHQEKSVMTGADQWEGRTKVDKTYNEYGDVLTEVRLTWDSQLRVWRGVVNEKREYGPMGDVLSEEKMRWDRRAQTWKPQSKSSYKYDDEHNKIAENTSAWNPLKDDYEEFFVGRTSYKLNRKGFITEVIEQTKEEGKWKTRQTTKYFFQ
ncbi:MAG: hypothetical protein II375_05980 [Bacteroidales bacterium]|nr:hypothetical protein [Bacteroidales bacterium]